MSIALESIPPTELEKRRADGESVELIDVRTPAEFRGVHAVGARNVPLDELDLHVDELRQRAAAGPLYAIYFSNLHLDRTALRVTISVSLLILAGMRITGYAGLGLYDRATLTVLGVALPFMWLGARLADRITARISAPAFNRIVGATLLVSGAALLLK